MSGLATPFALVDRGLVARRRDAEDRRRNQVELTERGVEAQCQGVVAIEAAEAAFLALLGA